MRSTTNPSLASGLAQTLTVPTTVAATVPTTVAATVEMKRFVKSCAMSVLHCVCPARCWMTRSPPMRRSELGSNSGDEEVREIMCHECPPLCLPSSLLDDEEPTYASQRPRRQRRNSDSKADRKQQSEIDRMKLSYRTKMCRSGFGACKFGQQCWFAHIQEELRKPSDPLPPQCPGVSKLEKYARRQD